jgi:glutaminyl-tRNA synthetase
MSTHEPSNFIRNLIDDDLKAGRHTGVITRFPPEPNGYLHIGHAKSICLNFGLARDYKGRCHLRFDDTNPTAEDLEFVASIQEDIRWLGFDWGEHLYHASEYFPQLYAWALGLIEQGKAYVCEQNEEEMRATRGTVTEPGTASPWRDRDPSESLALFERMKAGDFEEGSYTLRAKIDMANDNMKMRDPVIWRILRVTHHHIGEGWNVYPMYDFAHCLSDAIEHITHSLCTLEFDNNRALYDWLVEHCDTPATPHQYEFARLNLAHTVMSKRKLRALVEEGLVSGWDDPRMPTIAAMRRRGYRASAIRDFCERIGVAKANSMVDMEKLEFSVRNDLNHVAPRVMAVLRPLKVVLTNWEEDCVEPLQAPYWPPDVPNEGQRGLPLTREIYIDRDDFMEDPPKKFFRLGPGREVRLRYAYVIRCDEVIHNDAGEVTELRCTYDPDTGGGRKPEGRKVKGIVHWVSATESLPCVVRLYDRLFTHETPDAAEGTFQDHLNPGSLVTCSEARIERSVAQDPTDRRYQFERLGYFWRDPKEGCGDALVFNRIVPLKSAWAKTAAPASVPEEKSKKTQKTQKTPQKERVYTPMESAAFERLKSAGVPDADAATLASDGQLLGWFDQGVKAGGAVRTVANLVLNDVAAARKTGSLPFDGDEIGALACLMDDGTLSSKLGKKVLDVMLKEGGHPGAIAARHGWETIRDPDVLRVQVDDVLHANAEQLAQDAQGRQRLFGFLMGQVLKRTEGKGDPQVIRDLLQQALDALD